MTVSDFSIKVQFRPVDGRETQLFVIRMEQLSGIRKKTLVWNPHSNRKMSGWSFYQLQQFVAYKAKWVGIAVEFVNPAYTSQVCFSCRRPGLRVKDVFQCTTCGERHDEKDRHDLHDAGRLCNPEGNFFYEVWGFPNMHILSHVSWRHHVPLACIDKLVGNSQAFRRELFTLSFRF